MIMVVEIDEGEAVVVDDGELRDQPT